MGAKPLSPERRAEIDTFVAALPPSMAYVRGCFDDVLAEIDRLRLDNAWLENIAEGRGEESENIRRRLVDAERERDALAADASGVSS